jgi:hypothetical protein
MIWQSAWKMHIQPCVIEAWELALKDTLIPREEFLEPKLIRSHGDAIAQLDLPDGIVDPISLEQIRDENQ